MGNKVVVYGVLAAFAAVMIGVGSLSGDTSGRATSYAFIGAVVLLTVAVAIVQLRSARRTLGDRREADGASEEARALDDAGRISDVPEMFQLLALREFDPAGLRRLRRLMLSNTRIWIGLMLVLSAVPLTVIGLGAADALPDLGPTWAQAGLATIIAGIAVILAWMRWRVMGVADNVLEPLGLAEGETSDGEWMFSGERHGRKVWIQMGAEEWATSIAAAVRPFELRETRGRLRAEDEAPAEVRAVVERLRTGPGWRGIRQVRGGHDGIVLTRDPGSGLGHGWLWDLWLAERLASELAQGRES